VAILGTRFDDFDLERVALGADVILAGAAPRFDAGTLDRLGRRAIVRMGVGVDSIDLESSRRNGEAVAVAPMVEMAGALT
jgi:phosphoglycerate dehydrogenase-like enzyme